MPRLTNSPPRYRRHRASGQAVVTLDGKDHYLGLFGTKASRVEYDRLTGEWLAGGRRLPAGAADLTIMEMLARYWRFAAQHYRKDGHTTSEIENIRAAAVPLKKLYGHTRAADFGPLALKALRLRMIESGLCRGVVNGRVGRIKRIFKWAVSEELCPPSVLHGLQSVSGLQRGRSDARESAPVLPVDDATVEATLPHLSAVVADMVRLQRLLGCRPGEVCGLRPCDVDRIGDVWTYRPGSHKTEHHGKARVIFIGPRAQEILRPYLLRAAEDRCFTPIDSERRRKQELRARRKTKVQPSQRDRRKKRPAVSPSDRYSKEAYARAIRRACDQAFPPPAGMKGDELKAWRVAHRWAPNRLRHAAATEIRKQFGLEGAQVILGHSKADVTQVYAERDFTLAASIAAKIG